MGDLVIELIPSMLGLLVTPAAVVGVILLLSSARPFANAVAFMAGFLVSYGIIAAIVVALASTATGPLLTIRTRNVVDIVVGGFLLLLGLGLLARRQDDRQRARQAKRSFLSRLNDASPPFAFGAGVALAIINPNIAILVAGLATVAAAEDGHVGGAALLVLAAVSGMLIPILWRWLAPASSAARLRRVKAWIGDHDRTINIVVLLTFGVVFLAKGLV